MIHGIGIDLEPLKDFKKSMKNKNFIKMLFSKKEITYCKQKKNPDLCFLGKFCAKEAVIKALDKKVSIQEIEILNSRTGKPGVYIKNKMQKNIHCSISHTKDMAMAFVIID